MIANSRALLAIAQELLTSGIIEQNELKYRSAVSRAYYSVFLLAREKTRLENEVHDVHAKVFQSIRISLLRAGKFITFDKMNELKEHRKQADYTFPATNANCMDWEKCATNAVIQAGYALNHLERL